MRRIVPPLLLAFVLILSACGEPTGEPAAPDTTEAEPTTTEVVTTTTEAATFPVTIDTPEGAVALESRPERVVSLSATSTEMLYAIGAGDQVVATDLHSDHPAEARETEKVDAFDLNVEAVAALEPDLVVLAFDPGEASASFAELGIPALLHPAAEDLDDVYTQVEQLGVATGHEAEAAALVADMQTEIESIVASVPPPGEPITYYHELDPTFFSVTSGTFLGQLYALLGLESIADAADAGPYPQLSAEFILEADPDFIFLADTICCEVTAESLAERPGWDTLSAVREGRVIELRDDVASRWGPRIVELLELLAEEVEAVLEPAG